MKKIVFITRTLTCILITKKLTLASIFMRNMQQIMDIVVAISIRTVDTDIVVIAIHFFGKLGVEELWI